jgi:translocation protein SEC62
LADLLRNKVDQADAKVLGGSAACGCGDDGAVRRFDYMRAKDAIRAMVADPTTFGLDLGSPSDDDDETQGLLEKEDAKNAAKKAAKNKDALPDGAGAGASGSGSGSDRLAAAKAANEALAKLVRAGLLFRAERRFQKPKPGRKRRVKWPRTLVPLSGSAPGARPPALLPAAALSAILAADDGAQTKPADAKTPTPPQQNTDADADTFYVWSYDRPTSWLFYAGAGALLLGCAAVPLYPLAPHPVRLAVLYLLLALLSVIVGTVSIRGVVFSAVWILTGHSLWLLPNLLSEEVPLSQVLKPLVSLKAPKATNDSRKRALRVAARVGAGAIVLGVGALLARHGPSGGELRKAAGEANDALLAYMETMAGGATKRLHNGTDDSAAQQTGGKGPGGAKGAAAAAGGAAGGKAGAGAGARAPPPAPPPIPDEDEDDEDGEDKFDDAREEADQEDKEEEKKEEL